MDKVAQLTDLVEKSTIKDIILILNRATEMFSKGEILSKKYIEILLRVAKKAEKLATTIYNKTHNSGSPSNLDLEEYRTLLDIARECRDAVREIVLIEGIKVSGDNIKGKL